MRTIDQLLAGKTIDCPPLRHTDLTFKKAPKAAPVEHEALTLGLDE